VDHFTTNYDAVIAAALASPGGVVFQLPDHQNANVRPGLLEHSPSFRNLRSEGGGGQFRHCPRIRERIPSS